VTSAQVELQVASSYLSSISYKIDEVTLRVEHEYQGWSLMDNQKIVNDQDVLLVLERNFEDSQAYRFRLDYALDDGVILHGGLSYEDGVTPEEYHGPGLAEHDQVEAGLGLTWPFNDSLSLHSTFFYQHFFDRRVVSSLQKPTTNGDYTDRRQYLTLNLRWKL
jgi:long-subunit fatty acid transport protein